MSEHDEHQCKAVAITCMDYRIQAEVRAFLLERFGEGQFDMVTIAGAALNSDFALEQVMLSHRLHHISEVVVLNHQECGGYGDAGTFERHKQDMLLFVDDVESRLPDVEAHAFFVAKVGDDTEWEVRPVE